LITEWDKMPRKKLAPQVISSREEDKLFQWVEEKVEDAATQTGNWETNQEKWHKLRMRIKKSKTFPFVGCSNIRMPTAETKIRKLKAALYQTVLGIRPVCQVIPSPSGNLQTAMKIEKWLDHIILDIIDFKPKALIDIDQTLEKGFYLLKPYWRTEITSRLEEYSLEDLTTQEAMQLYDLNTTPEMIKKELVNRLEVDMSDRVAEDNDKELERVVKEISSGKDKIKIKLLDVLYDNPDVALCDPERVYVNSDSGFHPQACQMITHEFFIPFNQVKANVEHKGWSKEVVDEIEEDKDLDIDDDKTSVELQKEQREGIERINNPSQLVKIWETYCWYDLNDDDIDEKCVITSVPDWSRVLRKITLPFSNGKFPFVKTFYELLDDRWFSHRGIPEILEDIIKEIDIQHMQKIDQQTVRNAPMFVYRAGMVNPNLVQFMPNEAIPINGMQPLRDTIDVLNSNNPNVEYSYEKEQMILETKIEELIGQVDFTLQSMINRRQPRTLGEVELQNQNMKTIFSLDADMFTNCFSELFTMIFDLWCQYGSDQEVFAYLGRDGLENIRLTREEIQGKYKITVRGNDQNTNPQVKLQKAQQILMATTNPLYIQTGVITPIHMANGLKRFYQTLDVPNWEELMNDPKQIMQQMQQQQRQPPPDDIKLKGDDLTDAEKAQLLQKRGIQPDVQGRALRSRAITEDKQTEQSNVEFDQLIEIADKIAEEPKEVNSERR